MKKNYLFTLLLTLCFSAISIGQTTLSAGDVVAIQLQTDTPDTFKFVPLVDLEANTVIKFTENAWNGTELLSNESTITFTADAAISKGTNIEFVAGTADTRFSVSGNLGFSSSGDQLIIYQGEAASPTFIFAVQTNSTLWQTPPTNDTNISALPSGLTDGVNAVAAGSGEGDEAEWDNVYYNGTTIGTKEDLLANIALASNWIGVNNLEYTPITTDFTLTNVSVISLSITSPENNQVFPAETTTIPITLNIQNFTLSDNDGSDMTDNSGDGYIIGTLYKNGLLDGTQSIFSSSITQIDTAEPGTIYSVTAELVDNSGASLSPKVETTVTFSVDFPCDFNLGTIESTCNAITAGQDTYDISIPFTGGNTSTYTLTADSGTIGGDDPSTTTEGTITITDIVEGTDVVFTLKGDVANSNCDVTRTISSPTCVPAPTCPTVGALIVTEIMQNPGAVGDSEGEYFEVYNTSNDPIDMQGWLIKSLTTNSKDHIIASSLVVPAKGYVVLGINSDINANGGVNVDYQYSSNFYIGNSSDSIALECGATVIDSVSWDNGATFPDPTGKSMELAISKYSASDNDNGVNWGEATQEIITDGDLGTPGAANSFTLSIVKNEIEGFATYPNPVTNNSFTISSNNTDQKEVKIFNVLGKQVFTSNYSGTKFNVNIPTISAGLYILKVTEGTKTATSKLVIK